MVKSMLDLSNPRTAVDFSSSFVSSQIWQKNPAVAACHGFKQQGHFPGALVSCDAMAVSINEDRVHNK